ncbi:MAG: hypothetical protein AMXMBFR61_18620 [Fimbriimonadales bacterium]
MDRDATWCKAVLMIGLATSSVALLVGGLLYAVSSAAAGWVASVGVWTLIGTPLVALILSGAVRGSAALIRGVAVVALIALAVVAEVMR